MAHDPGYPASWKRLRHSGFFMYEMNRDFESSGTTRINPIRFKTPQKNAQEHGMRVRSSWFVFLYSVNVTT